MLSVLVAGVYPLPQSQRFRSSINVVPDAGREETFVIDWQQDRIQPLRADHAGAVRASGGFSVLGGAGGMAAVAEVFRLRDVAGNVIGLASRSISPQGGPQGGQSLGQGSVSEWMLLLPSRGTLFLSQVNARDIAPRPAEQQAGELQPAFQRAGFWAAGPRLRISPAPDESGAGRVTGGTGEFARLSGSYEESWELDEAPAGRVPRGRILLTTRVKAAP